DEIKKELATLSEIDKWNFVFATQEDIKNLYSSLKTDIQLDDKLGTPYVFIIDKDFKLRGRTKDENEDTKYGFNSNSVADLNNKMIDDIKIVLAEYRLALKKNKIERTE
ncbi:MAG: hypothetical protein V7734_18000, partial [Maribacter arcticus]